MQCWHLTFATDERLPIVETETQRRRAVWVLGQVTRTALILFCFVDDHVHIAILCPEERLGWARRAITLGLRSVLAADVAPTGTKEIEHRGHLESLVTYFVQQTKHHRLPVHAARWSGSCFQDLVRARCVPTITLRLFDLLPRTRPSDVFGRVGLPIVEPASDVVVRAAGAARVARASSAALGVGPDLVGRSVAVARARRAGAQVAAAAGIGAGDVEWALGISQRSRRRFVAETADLEAQRAIRLQIAIEDAVAAGQRCA